jgi:hypothetical protein
VIKQLRHLGAGVNPILLAGDLMVFVVATVLGFQRHGELAGSAWERMLATLIPFCAAWLLIAPWLGVYQTTLAAQRGQLWRPPLAACLAAPLGAWLRGLWLGQPVLVIFVAVMAGVTAGLMLAWRLIFVEVRSRSAGRQGSGGTLHG